MEKRIVAIDPGPVQSGFLVWGNRVIEHGTLPNLDLRQRLKENHFGGAGLCAIETFQAMGMTVGREVFDTCIWVGRFMEASRMPVQLVYRTSVKLFLCGESRAKDKNIRQALLDRIGPQGTKKAPGPLYGVSGHAWSALALAVYAASIFRNTEP